MAKRKFKISLEMVGGAVAFFILLVVVLTPYFGKAQYNASLEDPTYDEAAALLMKQGEASSTPVFVVTHVAPPQATKAIYMTACVSTVRSWREQLEKMINDTELNAVVIDIKDYTGTISFIDNEIQAVPGEGCRAKDMQAFIGELHKNNIYVIGRVAVFQDPLMTALHPEWAVKSKTTGGVWKDRKGLSFIDVGAKPYWDHVVEIAKHSYALGFDEINFDYIRYPSDGNMKDANYTWMNASSTKAETLKSFFSYLHERLKNTGMKTSADLFGMTTTNTDDLGIGQILENALLYFDYVDPMVYPSHYPATWAGFDNPAAHPYDVIKIAMTRAVEREAALRVSLGIATSTPSKLRPWIQDFDLGADYNAPEVRAQMKATYDSGLTSWLSWAASNKYTTDAYLTE